MAPIIRVEGLVKTFGDITAVRDVSFAVAAGKIFAFLGPNGAGKTTTIKMLTTLLPPTSGSVEIDGQNPATHAIAVRRKFGIVFQDPSLDQELTAAENMRLHAALYSVPKAAREERIERLLKVFELWDRRDSLVKQFSGGMRRRLEIARGLLDTPKILFLDEPTLGLDPQTRNQLWTLVKQLNEEEGVTIFLTTHYMDEAERVAQRIAIIFNGIELIWDRQFGFLKETLVAPVSRLTIMTGRTLGGATVSLIQGVIVAAICLIAGFRPSGLAAAPLAFVFMALVAVMFTAFGTAIASMMEDFQGFQLVMNFLVMPTFFLSGALFPLTNVPTLIGAIATIDPLSYGVDGVRGALTGVFHFGVARDFGVLAILTLACLAAGSYRFSRIQL